MTCPIGCRRGSAGSYAERIEMDLRGSTGDWDLFQCPVCKTVELLRHPLLNEEKRGGE